MSYLPHVLFLSAGLHQPLSFEEGPEPEVRFVYQPASPMATGLTGHLALRSYFGVRTSDFGLHREYDLPGSVEVEAGVTLFWTLPR